MTQIQQIQTQDQIQDQVKIQVFPYKKPRKRRTEVRRFVVKWVEEDTLYFRWYVRDFAACRFLNELIDAGYEARVIMK